MKSATSIIIINNGRQCSVVTVTSMTPRDWVTLS